MTESTLPAGVPQETADADKEPVQHLASIEETPEGKRPIALCGRELEELPEDSERRPEYTCEDCLDAYSLLPGHSDIL